MHPYTSATSAHQAKAGEGIGQSGFQPELPNQLPADVDFLSRTLPRTIKIEKEAEEEEQEEPPPAAEDESDKGAVGRAVVQP